MTDTILVDERGHFKIGKAATTPHNEAEGFIAWPPMPPTPGASRSRICSAAPRWCSIPAPGCSTPSCRAPAASSASSPPRDLEDMVLMGRGLQAWADYSYADRLHAVTHHHPEPLVLRKRTHGVTERIDQFGDVIIPLYEHEVAAAARKLLADHVDSICIMTIFSHVNPAHEKRIAEIVRDEIAKAGVSVKVYASREVRPVIREQSRLNSVLIEAYATGRGRKQLTGIEEISRHYGFRYGVQTLLPRRPDLGQSSTAA